MLKSWLKENLIEALGGGILGLILIVNAPRILDSLHTSNVLRDKATEGMIESQSLQIEQELAQRQAEIANNRLDMEKCLPMHSLTREGKLTTISEGQPVLKGEFVDYYRYNSVAVEDIPLEHFIPSAHCIVDATGMTARLEPLSVAYPLPVARKLAKTGDQERIDKEFEGVSATLDPFVQ